MSNISRTDDVFTAVLAPWGDPFRWREAKYRVKTGSGTSLKSRTSLIPLIKEFDPNLVMVMIPETLSCLAPSSLEEYLKYSKSIPGSKTISDVLEAEDLEKGYGELMGNLRKTVAGYIEKDLDRTDSSKLDIVVDVAPNAGTYSCTSINAEWRFPEVPSVSPDGAYFSYFLTSTLHHVLSRLAGGKYSRVDVVLDTTHGINYTVAAAIEASVLAARMISMIEGVEVTFKQFNSTPFPPRSERSVPELEIYEVKEEALVPVKAAQRLVYSYCAVKDLRNMIPGEDSEMGAFLQETSRESDFKRVYRIAAPLVASVHYSLPLAFLQFSQDASEGLMKKRRESKELKDFDPYNLDKHLYELLNDILYKVKVAPQEDAPFRWIIQHKLIPDHRKVKGLLSAFAFIRYGERALDHSPKSCNVSGGKGADPRSGSNPLRNCVVEASLEDLQRVLEHYVRGPMIFVARHELSQIEASLSGKARGSGCQKWYWDELLERARANEGRWESSGYCEKPNSRNFIAHLGISKELVEVKVVRDEEERKVRLYLRYRRKCKRYLREVAAMDPIGEIRELISLTHRSADKGMQG